MRQTRVSIYIPIYVSYEYTKFSNDLSTLTEEDACRVGQSNTKIKFCTGTRHFSGPIYHLKMRFCLIFKYLIVFIICIWQRTKPRLHKDRSQKLISTIFSISDPLERELKIMTTFDQWIYTFMIVFYFCNLLLLQKGILSLFSLPDILFWARKKFKYFKQLSYMTARVRHTHTKLKLI